MVVSDPGFSSGNDYNKSTHFMISCLSASSRANKPAIINDAWKLTNETDKVTEQTNDTPQLHLSLRNHPRNLINRKEQGGPNTAWVEVCDQSSNYRPMCMCTCYGQAKDECSTNGWLKNSRLQLSLWIFYAPGLVVGKIFIRCTCMDFPLLDYNSQLHIHRNFGILNILQLLVTCSLLISISYLIRYHRLPLVTIGYHRLPSVTIGYHRLSTVTIGYYRSPLITISYHRLPVIIGFHRLL